MAGFAKKKGNPFLKAAMFYSGFLSGSMLFFFNAEYPKPPGTGIVCDLSRGVCLCGRLGAGFLFGLLSVLVPPVGLFCTDFNFGVSYLIITFIIYYSNIPWIAIGKWVGISVIIALCTNKSMISEKSVGKSLLCVIYNIYAMEYSFYYLVIMLGSWPFCYISGIVFQWKITGQGFSRQQDIYEHADHYDNMSITKPQSDQSTCFITKPNPFKKDAESDINCFYISMKSVCAILSADSHIGTGFRVGEKYLMTADHVVSAILDYENRTDESDYTSDSDSGMDFAVRRKTCQLGKRYRIKVSGTKQMTTYKLSKSQTKKCDRSIKTPGSTVTNKWLQHNTSCSTVIPELQSDQSTCFITKPNHFKKDADDTLTESDINCLSSSMKSVGAIVSAGSHFGTGFRVGKKHIITANHVVAAIYEHHQKTTGGSSWPAAYLLFHESPLARQPLFELRNVEYRDSELDIAVIEVCNPENLPEKLVLSKTECKMQEVHVVGYGHQNLKKHVDPKCKVLHPNADRVWGVIEWNKTHATIMKQILLNNNQDPNVLNDAYKYLGHEKNIIIDTFMEKGVSGGPMLLHLNANSVCVFGVVTHGEPEYYFHLPPDIQAQFPKQCRFEIGVKTTKIYESMMKTNPNLANDIFM